MNKFQITGISLKWPGRSREICPGSRAAQQSGLANSSAEVITEAPSSEFGPLPLADFGTVDYSGPTVNGSSMDAQNPTQIIMVGSSGHQLDSTGSMDGAGDFSNTWLAES
jgi:hypothetical protein